MRLPRLFRTTPFRLTLLFLALFVNLNVVQVFQGDRYRDDPANRRVLLNEPRTCLARKNCRRRPRRNRSDSIPKAASPAVSRFPWKAPPGK